MSAGKSCMRQRNNLAQNKGGVGLIYCSKQVQVVDADCSGTEHGMCD